jgi:hypothetical protein
VQLQIIADSAEHGFSLQEVKRLIAADRLWKGLLIPIFVCNLDDFGCFEEVQNLILI